MKNSKYCTKKIYTRHDFLDFTFKAYQDIELYLKGCLKLYFSDYVISIIDENYENITRRLFGSIATKLHDKQYDKLSTHEKAIIFDSIVKYLEKN